MALNVELLRSSFEMVAPKADQLADRFYQILFEQSPELKPLFSGTDMGIQRRMLIDSLVCIMGLLEDSKVLEKTLFDLGQKHAAYDVIEDHFPLVGNALIAALAEIAGPDWSDHLEAVWTEAFEAIANGMIAGMRAVRPVKV